MNNYEAIVAYEVRNKKTKAVEVRFGRATFEAASDIAAIARAPWVAGDVVGKFSRRILLRNITTNRVVADDL